MAATAQKLKMRRNGYISRALLQLFLHLSRAKSSLNTLWQGFALLFVSSLFINVIAIAISPSARPEGFPCHGNGKISEFHCEISERSLHARAMVLPSRSMCA
jgi:hypothetical protein